GGGDTAGVGIVIENGFQKDRKEIEKVSEKVKKLAILETIENDKVYFK
ncbi:xanthine phosphoribosyltransferase, partial [Clostridium botulinum]|nr:xanthine phosphoribosyltransferase [Clostridium botulinum]